MTIEADWVNGREAYRKGYVEPLVGFRYRSPTLPGIPRIDLAILLPAGVSPFPPMGRLGYLEGVPGWGSEPCLTESGMGEIVMASIVLADDDEDLRSIYAPCLRSAGHTVWEASGGLEALELVRQHRPSLLILDVWMPRCNGFEVLESLRHDPASNALKVLMLSNLGDADTRLESFEMGATEYLVKGLALTDLLARVGELLARESELVLEGDPRLDQPV